MTIRFSPLSRGAFSGDLRITSNAIGAPVTSIPLYGTSLLPPSPATLLAPDDQAVRLEQTVTFRWRTALGGDGRIVSEYLLLDESPDFTYRPQVHGNPAGQLAKSGLLLFLLLPLAARRQWLLRFLPLAILALLLSCGTDGDNLERSLTVSDLQPATTYYWKIMAEDHLGSTSTSPTRLFTTAAAPLP